MKWRMRDVVLAGMALVVGTTVAPGSIAAAADFYVAPAGDDANPGTRQKPLQSFAGTRCGARSPAG